MGVYVEVPITLAGIDLPVDLMEFELGRYEVILGMDWLTQQKAVVDCAKSCVRIPRGEGWIVFQGVKTRMGVTIISMARAEKLISQGGEAYLATIDMVGETEAPDMQDIPVAAEYVDVFEPLNGPPPNRGNVFTIELEPSTAPVSKAPY